MKRFRFKRDKTVSYPLIKEARLAREKAEQLPPGEEREGRRATPQHTSTSGRLSGAAAARVGPLAGLFHGKPNSRPPLGKADGSPGVPKIIPRRPL